MVESYITSCMRKCMFPNLLQKNTHTHTRARARAHTRVELLVSHQTPSQVADRGTLIRNDGYRGNKIPGADQN